MRIQSYLILFYEYQKSLIIFTKSLENQFIYPYPKIMPNDIPRGLKKYL